MRRRLGPGSTTIKLCELLAAELTKQGHQVRMNPDAISGVTGYWRKADCYRWEGYFEIFQFDKWQKISIGCWDTMTECVRKGVEVEWDTTYSTEAHARG